jgi:DNA-binding NtrC family response regulator
VLVVDDEAAIRFGIRDFLEAHGFDVLEADSCQAARERIREQPDVVLLDFRLPDGDALGLLATLKDDEPDIPVVVLTAHASVDIAVQAVKLGAEQFLTKPVELPAVLVLIERMLDNVRVRRSQRARRTQEAPELRDPFLGESRLIRELEATARRVLASDSPVLLQGETGSGKGVLAAWLHAQGPRAEEPFVQLNCAGLTAQFLETELFGHERGAFTGAVARKLGLLEVAHHGTVFLDEIGDVDPSVQPKLLKVLEEKRFRRMGDVEDRRVDIRLIAATHQDLAERVRTRHFRSDLFFRISTLPLGLPALRERPEDIPHLAWALLAHIARQLGRPPMTLSPAARAALQGYAWPGNIRELRNVLERAVLLSSRDTLEASDLRFDPGLGEPGAPEEDPLSLTLEEVEKRHIQRVLAAEGGHVERAARRLGLPRSSLYHKLKRYGLSSKV